ncbi:MAG: AmmeMemoRadiSam system radical SAM enzyme [Clostridia bacterium]|nr:AmmeMemoRadiSam system radical SAM enzyme [Clostridia bacterium]
MKEAMFYEKLDELKVRCTLCPHGCIIKDGGYGRCQVRFNQGGVFYAINYGKITAHATDPIEKKPLYHFYPGEEILSVASFGCNMTCVFCQNYQLSQKKYNLEETTPEALVEAVNDFGIAFTYNEPTIWFEYVYEVAKLLKRIKPDKKVVLITNGLINEAPLKLLLPYVDAFNVDLKAFTQEGYKKMCHGDLQTVLKAIQLMASKHVEVTSLMVPGLVDLKQIKEISEFIAKISKQIPLHLSRYYPAYHYDAPQTTLSFALEAERIAKKSLDYVYLGNFPDRNNNTYCAHCGYMLVSRIGYVTKTTLNTEICPHCQTPHGIKVRKGE